MNNFTTNVEYTGCNITTLMEAGYDDSNEFATFYQARKFWELSGKELKGAKACARLMTIVLKKDKEGKEKKVPKYFSVFEKSELEAVIASNATVSSIKVIHRAFEDLDEVESVATIRYDADLDVEGNLEMAYRLTNNIEGSWSKGEFFDDGRKNSDYSDAITFTGEMFVRDNGKVMGARSTSCGDLLLIGDVCYVVADWGFEIVDFDEISKLDGRAVIKHLFASNK